MGKEEGLMSVGEADRAALIRDVVEKRLGRREAAERLGIGVRQIKRLARRYRERGAAGLVSGHRGKRPNNAIDAAVRREVVDLVRKRYRDFGSTFAHEKLVEEHGHRLSVETLRKWMIADGLWRAKARREVPAHQSRPRRECLGDSPSTTRSAEWPSTGVPPRVAQRLPTLARLSPTTPQLGNKFFLLEKKKGPNRKRGYFCFALTARLPHPRTEQCISLMGIRHIYGTVASIPETRNNVLTAGRHRSLDSMPRLSARRGPEEHGTPDLR